MKNKMIHMQISAKNEVNQLKFTLNRQKHSLPKKDKKKTYFMKF